MVQNRVSPCLLRIRRIDIEYEKEFCNEEFRKRRIINIEKFADIILKSFRKIEVSGRYRTYGGIGWFAWIF